MSTVAIEPEVVGRESDTALTVAKEANVSHEVALNLNSSFAPLFNNARSVLEKSRAITVTDASQKLEIKLARECRLALRKIRIESKELHDTLKSDSLSRGRAIDGFHNILLHLVDAEEARLNEQEKFVERQEATRKAQLKADREAALAPYALDTAFMSLGEMPDESFAQLLENTRMAHEAKLAAARKAEDERILLENERLKEEARIREENERLKREAAEREEAQRIERDRVAKEKAEAEAKARAEREALEAAAAEQRRKASEALQAAEQKAKREREAAEAKAAQERLLAAEQARREREAIEAKAKAERLAAEEAARKERLRLQAIADVERQKTEAARAAAETAAHNERVKREQAEAEIRAAKESEAARVAAEAEAVRQAALAPDKEKILECAIELRSIAIPSLSTDEGRAVTSLLTGKLEKIAAWIEQEASVL